FFTSTPRETHGPRLRWTIPPHLTITTAPDSGGPLGAPVRTRSVKAHGVRYDRIGGESYRTPPVNPPARPRAEKSSSVSEIEARPAGEVRGCAHRTSRSRR